MNRMDFGLSNITMMLIFNKKLLEKTTMHKYIE